MLTQDTRSKVVDRKTLGNRAAFANPVLHAPKEARNSLIEHDFGMPSAVRLRVGRDSSVTLS